MSAARSENERSGKQQEVDDTCWYMSELVPAQQSWNNRHCMHARMHGRGDSCSRGVKPKHLVDKTGFNGMVLWRHTSIHCLCRSSLRLAALLRCSSGRASAGVPFSITRSLLTTLCMSQRAASMVASSYTLIAYTSFEGAAVVWERRGAFRACVILPSLLSHVACALHLCIWHKHASMTDRINRQLQL